MKFFITRHIFTKKLLLALLGGGILCGILALFSYMLFFWHHSRAVTESIYSEMHSIPSDVQLSMNSIAPTRAIRIPILMYHYVEHVKDLGDTIRQSLNTPPEIFEAQIKTLKEAGFTFITAREVGYILDGERSLPDKPIVITIDDGHWDVYTDILPILQKYQTPVTLYHIAGFTGKSDSLNDTQLRAVIASGLVEIGAHTVHHIGLKDKSRSEVLSEVFLSKKILEMTYGIHVDSFAYPNGEFDLQAIDAVRKAGFTTAVSTIPGIDVSQDNRYFIYRLRPGRRTGQDLVHWLSRDRFSAFGE